MAQLKQDEWPADREPTTEEQQVGLAERDQPDPPGGVPHGEDLLNIDPDSAVD